MATLQDIFNQIVNSGGNFQGSYQYQDPNAALDNMSTGYQNLSSYDMLNDYVNQYGTQGLQTFSGMGNIGEGGAYGGYSYSLDNTDGNYSLTNPQFTAGQQKGSWFDENLHIIGPLILAAASAGAGAPALYDAGAGMGADGMAAMATGGTGSSLAATAGGSISGDLGSDWANGQAVTNQQSPGWTGEGDTQLQTQPGWQGEGDTATMPPATQSPANVGNVVNPGTVNPGASGVGAAVPGGLGSAATTGATTAGTQSLLQKLFSGSQLSADDWAKLAGSLGQVGLGALESYQNNQTANRLLDMFSRYNSDADFYGNKLRETYTNPLSYLQGPEYQSIQNVAGDYLQRKDAAGGNLANNFGRQSKLQDLAMSNLNQYRQGLSGTYQNMAGISTGQGAQGAVAASGTANTPLYRSLGQLFSTGN